MQIPRVGSRYHTNFQVLPEQVLKFAELSGDDNPIHVSPDQARDFGFNHSVAHGAILLAEISRIIGTELPGHGAFWTDINIEFLGPVYWGDTVTIVMEVIQSSEAINMVKQKIEVSKHRQKILSGTCRVVCLQKLNRRFPMPEIANRTALVTGGSRGLGLAIVKELLQEGYKVISLSRQESDSLRQLAEEYHQLRILCHDLCQLSSIASEISGVDLAAVNVIIHAAGPLPLRRKLHPDLYQEIAVFTDIYLNSLIRLIAICSRNMKKNKYGRIVTIGTSFILGTPPADMYSYVVAKEALWGLTKSLAVEYGRYGITANMVSPSMMITDMTADIPNAVKYNEAQSNPLKRLVEPEEVAKTVKFLCGADATFINGANIPITGGK